MLSYQNFLWRLLIARAWLASPPATLVHGSQLYLQILLLFLLIHTLILLLAFVLGFLLLTTSLTASVVPTSMSIHFIFFVVLNSDPQLLPATIVFFNSLLAPHAFLVLLFRLNLTSMTWMVPELMVISSSLQQCVPPLFTPQLLSSVKIFSTLLKAAGLREHQKDSMYLERSRAQGKLFFPLVFESFGAIGKRCMQFISLLTEEGAGNGITSVHWCSTQTIFN